MKHLALLCFSLCLIAALTPAASAVGMFVNHTIVGEPVIWNQSYAINMSPTEACAAYGLTPFTGYEDDFLSIWFKQTTDQILAGPAITGATNYTLGGAGYNALYPGNYSWSRFNDTITYPSVALYAECAGPKEVIAELHPFFNSSVYITVNADFTGTPITGVAPLIVSFQDNSTGSPTLFNWTVTPPDGLVGNVTTSAYPTIAFTEAGNYTINHCAANPYNSDCEEKVDYITVYDGSEFVNTTFWAVDPLGHRVWDSAIFLQDVQNSSWYNSSSPSGGVASITSLSGHTINGYAEAAGYNDGETLGITADGISGGIILMTPTNITNVSTGYVTLYVYAKESVGNTPISGVFVNLAYAEGGSQRNDGGTTSAEGIVSFTVPNNTLIYVYGEKAGYERVSTTKDSGPGSGGDASISVILYMGTQTVTPTVTATTGPGGTVPVTVDPRTPQEKESDIALILINYGDMLVMFFIALTVIGGVKMIMR